VAAYRKSTAEPRLALFRATTGEQVCQLFGHVAPARSLAVTADGRLLASAAEDQTVCLWSMTDLNDVLGRHGTLGGVRFHQDEKGAVVSGISEPRAAPGLRVGDRVTGVTLKDDREPRPVGSVLDLLKAVWQARPGERVRLQAERDGKQVPVEMVVRQGVGAKAPLLSLFLAGRPEGEPGWIAWTPSGHFDASGPDVEQYVGWQFNPTRPGEQRIRFAPLNEYRDRFYEKLLLKHLVATASAERARAEIAHIRAIPRPELTVGFAGADRAPKGAGGAYLVQQPDVELRLTIDGPALDDDEVESVVLTSDGKRERLDLRKASGKTLLVPVTLPKRQDRAFTVTVRTREGLHEANGELRLRYQPPPPVVELDHLPKERTEVKDARFGLHVRVRPATPNQAVKVSRLELNGRGLALPTDLDFRVPLTLNVGENELVVEAVNADAPAGDRDADTTRVTRTLVYEKEQTPQPQFTEVETVPAGATRPLRYPARASDLLTVDTQRVRLRGTVAAQQPLAEATLRVGTDQAVDVLGERRAAPFKLDRTIALPPGKEVKVTLEARTERSDVGRASLRLKYLPGLPELELTEPIADEAVIDRDHRGFAEVGLKGVLKPAADFQPFEVDVWVSPKDGGAGAEDRPPDRVVTFTKAEDLPADATPRRLTDLRLGPGTNRIVVRVKNRWQAGDPLVRYVAYRQPPRVVGGIVVPPTVKQLFVSMKARVESPAGLPLTEVRINGKSYDVSKAATKQPGPRDGVSAWDVVINAVPLAEQGKNAVRLQVRNRDGVDEASAAVVVSISPPPKATIEVLNRPANDNVSRSPFPLDVRVESQSDLRALRLVQGSKSRDLQPENRTRQRQGFYEWTGSVPLDLREGDNALAIEAENDGGVVSLPLTLNFVPQPVQLILDSIQPPTAGARAALKGRVRWREPRQAQRVLAQLSQVKVYVNDLLQPPPRALRGAANSLEQPFVVDLVLNREKNVVQVDTPFPLDDESRRSTEVACKEPETPGTLRVLLVNAGAEDVSDDHLLQRARSALQLESDGEVVRNPVFDRVVLYPSARGQPSPLSRHVTREKVRRWLQIVQDDVDEDARARRAGPGGTRAGDVVLIYWLGKDLVADERGDWYLPTSDTAREPAKSPAVTGQSLRQLLDADHEVPGARLLVLDLAAPRAQGNPESDWSRSRAGVVRYAWARDTVPEPGLLTALDTAVKRTAPVSVQTWKETALRRAKESPDLRLTDQLPDSLAKLVLVQRRAK
jgi:hypothetical protein